MQIFKLTWFKLLLLKKLNNKSRINSDPYHFFLKLNTKTNRLGKCCNNLLTGEKAKADFFEKLTDEA